MSKDEIKQLEEIKEMVDHFMVTEGDEYGVGQLFQTKFTKLLSEKFLSWHQTELTKFEQQIRDEVREKIHKELDDEFIEAEKEAAREERTPNYRGTFDLYFIPLSPKGATK